MIDILREWTQGRVPLLMFALMFITIPLLGNAFQDLDGCIPIFLITTCCVLAVIWIVVSKMWRRECMKISMLDVSLTLYICYGGVHLLVFNNSFFDPVVLCEWIGLVAIYILARNFKKDSVHCIFHVIFFGGIIQAFIGMCQYLDVVSSNNETFKITGSFFNPGPWGGYLALSFVAGIEIWRKDCFAINKKGGVVLAGLLVLLFSLVVSDSRAAWVAVVVTLFFSKDIFLRLTRIRYFKVISIVLILLFSGIIYFYKKESADVRLLTWNSSYLMFKERPFLGHGVGSFSSRYMLYQADYLDENPDGMHALIANNNILAFNEFIHLGCEQGGFGLILFVLLLACAMTGAGNLECSGFSRRGLLCLVVFSCFSYTASVYSLKIFFPLFFGVLGRYTRVVHEVSLRRVFMFSLAVVFLAAVVFNLKIFSMYREVFNSLNRGEYMSNNFAETDRSYSGMKHNKNFLYRLSEQFLKADQLDNALIVKNRLLDVAPTSSLLCDVGMLYMQREVVDSAECCFSLAGRMTPNHVLPAYGLFLVEKERGNRAHGLLWAKKIVDMPVRVVNNIVLKARKEARAYIQEREIDTMGIE